MIKRYSYSFGALAIAAIIAITFLSKLSYAQLYSGPANGSVPNGVVVSTDNFMDFRGDQISPYVKQPRNELDEAETQYPAYLNNVRPKAPEGSNKIKIPEEPGNIESNPILLRTFQGFNDPGNYIPPDQHCAVGPTHVVGVDNSRFRIWDKAGNLIKSINADSWFATALTSASVFDPKIEYDHFNKRWIMVWLDQNATRGYFLVSVSDDSIPLGTWYNYAIKSSLNGNTESGTWSDYEGVGFDNQAVYITGRQFGFSGGFYGCKLRIIDKANLYANNAGQLTWTDMWSIRDPNNPGVTPDGIRPTIIYGSPGEYYFMVHGPFAGSNSYVILYKLTNPLTAPVLTGADIPVTAYSNAPNASQLGGGALLIEAGGSNLRNEPTYRSGFLWFVHSVNSGTGYSNVRYLKINPATNSAVEDVSFGADPYYHFYPAIAVDKDQNLMITYSRSSPNEYVGAYYTYKLSTDPPGLAGSRAIQVGKTNYVKDFGGGRNRWGDYMGAWVDPGDQNNFWIISQYAETPINTWGCWMANLRVVPFSGAHIYTFSDTLNFGNKEVNVNNTDTLSIKVYNYGSSVLTISALTSTSASFTPVGNPNLPINLNNMDSLGIKVLCKPTAAGNFNDTLKITTNDATTPVKKIILRAHGYVITPVTTGVMYGVAGSQESGALVTINTTTGAGTAVGPTGYSALTGLSIKKTSGQLYGTFASSVNTPLVRINSGSGDAYIAATIPISNVRALAWDMTDQLYIAPTDGRIYKFNPLTNDTIFVGSTGITNLYGLAFSPVSNNLWGVTLSGQLYKINKATAASTLVGAFGSGLWTSIAFDLSGKLYAIKGLGTQVSDLYTADTTTAVATLIGTTGKKGISGISLSPNVIGIQPVGTLIPDKFALYQNYPNPFNPSTVLKFDVPEKSFVKISIYDVTGRLVTLLVNQNMSPGRFTVDWNASNYPSGVYFYHIEANKFNESKKMVLVK